MPAKENPFCPGNGIMPPYLAGRETEIAWFEKSLDSALSLPQNLVLSGIRGTGKTVLLKKFELICADKKWLFAKREFNTKQNTEVEFANAFLTDVTVKAKGISWANGLGKTAIGFGKTSRAEEHGDLIALLLEKHHGPLGDRLEGILRDAHSAIQAAGYNGLVFLYDEFHFIEDNKAKNEHVLSLLLECLSHLQQEGLRYYLVLSGLPQLFANLVGAKTYAERMFSVKTLRSLSADASRQALSLPLTNSAIRFSDQLIELLVKETQGYPYFLQFFPYFLIQNLPKALVEVEDFQALSDLLLQELDQGFFSGRFDRASDNEQKVLIAMGSMGSAINIPELKKTTGLDSNYLNQVIIGLMEKGLIYRMGRGKYGFALPLFERYLQRVKQQ